MATRREILGGAAAAIALPYVFLRPARAAEKVVLITPFRFDAVFIEMMNAAAGGHFAREGLDATVLGAPGTSVAIEQVITGQVQISMVGGIDFLRAVAGKNAPLLGFATMSQSSGFHMVSAKEKPVKSGADLRGKTVGIISVGGLTETIVDLMLAKAGVPKSEVKLVVAGHSPGEAELIHNGRIDCFVCNISVVLPLQKMNAPLYYLSIDTIAPAPGDVYYATRETIERKPDLVRAVLRAIRASCAELMTQPIAPIFARAAKDYEIAGAKDIDSLAALERIVIDQQWLSQGRENLLRNMPKLWQEGADALHQVGVIPQVDASRYYTNKFVDELAKS